MRLGLVVLASAFAIAVVGCGAGKSAGAAAMSPAQVGERVMPSVVSITTNHGSGSGFVVGADGWIATAYHVVHGVQEAKVKLADGRELGVDSVRYSADLGADVALVHVAAHDLPVVKLGSTATMKPGDRLVAVGTPRGMERTMSDGLFNGIRETTHSGKYVQISAPISPGSSGGAVLDEHAEVIGIAAMTRRDAQNLNFATPVEGLQELLASDVAPLSMAEVAARAGDRCGRYGLFQCSMSCWVGGDGAACTFMGETALRDGRKKEARELYEEACALGASAGCNDPTAPVSKASDADTAPPAQPKPEKPSKKRPAKRAVKRIAAS